MLRGCGMKPGASISVWLALAILAATPAPVAAQSLVVSAGAFNLSSGKSEVEVGLGWRFAPRVRGVAPEVGAAVTGEGASYVFAGLRRDFALGSGWALAPFWGTALYEAGSGRELGGAIEFRSGLELSRAIGDRERLGLALYHLSNAGIYDRNPGSNSLVLTWSRSP